MKTFIAVMVMVAVLLSLTACASSENTPTETSSPKGNVNSVVSKPESEEKTSELSQSSDEDEKTQANTSLNNKESSSPKKTNSSSEVPTSSKPLDESPTVAVNPVVNYDGLERKIQNYLKENSKYEDAPANSFFYTLDDSFYIIPKEFLTVFTDYSFLETGVKDNEEYIKYVEFCQYKNYLYTSEVENALKRDLEILEKFAECAPISFTLDGVAESELIYENFEDIPTKHLRKFCLGSSEVPTLTVVFSESIDSDVKVKVRFDSYSTKDKNISGVQKINYSVNIYVNYNIDN